MVPSPRARLLRPPAQHRLGAGVAATAARIPFSGASIKRLGGFDTFWYSWSLNNPETELLR